MSKKKVKKDKFTITVSVEDLTVSVQYSGPFPEHLRGLAVIQTENLFKMQVEDEQGKPDLVDYEAVCSHVKSE